MEARPVGSLCYLVTQDQQLGIRIMRASMVSNMPVDMDLANRRYLSAKSEAGWRYSPAKSEAGWLYTPAGYPT